jgi:acyl carrier protein
MTEQEFIDNFNSAVDFQDPIEMTIDTRLDAMPEWDSLAALGVIVMFDVSFRKKISGQDLEKMVTLRDIYNLAIA